MDSFLMPSRSESVGLDIVWSHLLRAPGPPRTCSPRASSVSRSESACGLTLPSDGCCSGSSRALIERCRESERRLSSENASAPCARLASEPSQCPSECEETGTCEGVAGIPRSRRARSQRGMLDSKAGSTMITRSSLLDSRRSRARPIAASNECSSLCRSRREASLRESDASGSWFGTQLGSSADLLSGCSSSSRWPWWPSRKLPGWANWCTGQCLDRASMSSVCARGVPGGWSSMMMPSTSMRVNGSDPLSSPSTTRDATMSGCVPRSSFSSRLRIILKEVIPGPSQLPAADSLDRNECNSARAAVFPLPQFMSGSGLISGKASLAAS